MSRNRHDRVTNHFGSDLDTNSLLDGVVVDIPSGETVHRALQLIRTGGDVFGDDPIDYVDPDLYGTEVFYRTSIAPSALVQSAVHDIGPGNPPSQSLSFTNPVAGGSLLVALMATRSFSGTLSGPGDWTDGGQLNTNGFNSGDGAVWYKVADGSEGAGPFAFDTGAGTERRVVMAEFSGADFFADSATTTSVFASSYNIGNVTPIPGDPALLIAAALNSDAISGVTGYTTIANGPVGGGINGPISILAYKAVDPASGDYGATVVQTAQDIYGGIHLAFSETGDPWLPGPFIQDEDNATYHEANGTDCLRVAFTEPLYAYQATVRMAFSTGAERTYGFYGTNESDYSDLTLLDETTFAPLGSDVAENISFTWPVSAAYQYYVLVGPFEDRRLHEIRVNAAVGAATTSHPLATNRDLPEQHPATAIAFDDTVAGTGESTVQGALEILEAGVEGSVGGLSAVINNVTTGVKFDIEMPFAGEITEARLFANTAGSIVIDIWKDSYPNYAPTVADSICASAKPTLSSSVKSQDITLTGWIKNFNVGDLLRINVDSASALSRVTLALRFRKNKPPSRRTISVGQITQTSTTHEPSLTGGLKSISLGLISQAATINAPSVAGGSSVATQPITLARIARTAVPHAPTITGTAVGGSVFYMSPTGNDLNNGLTTSTPWRSLQKFINSNPAAGSTLYLRGGNYTQAQGGHTGDGVGDLIGTASQPITIRNYPGEVPVFPNMAGATITFRGNFSGSTVGANYVVLDGIHFTGCSPSDEAVLVIGNAGSLAATAYLVKNITVRNCFFSLAPGLSNRDHPSGMVHGCEFITFEDCEFQGPGAGGLGGDAIVAYSQPAARNIVVRRCIFHDWAHSALQVWDYNTSAPTATFTIEWCTFKTNASYDIDLRYHSTSVIRNCVFDGPNTTSTIYDPNFSGSTTKSFNYFSQTLTASYGLTAGSAAINGAHDGSDAGAVPYP